VQGAKAFFEQDLGPGEVFGEAALGGLHARMHLAQAITHVEVVVIDDSDFMAAQVRLAHDDLAPLLLLDPHAVPDL
jgi:CRP-like cAMP-binding protein